MEMEAQTEALPPSEMPPTLSGPVRLYVGGLTEDMKADILAERFKPFGTVLSCDIVPAKYYDGFTPPDSDKCRGFAYVNILPKDDPSLKRCLALYNGCKWRGCVLRVQIARLDYKERLQREWEAEQKAQLEAKLVAEATKDPAGPYGRREDGWNLVVAKSLELLKLLAPISEPYRQRPPHGEVESSESDTELSEPELEPEPRFPWSQRSPPAKPSAVPPRSPPAAPRPCPPAKYAHGVPAKDDGGENTNVELPTLQPIPVTFSNPWSSLFAPTKPVETTPTAAPQPNAPAAYAVEVESEPLTLQPASFRNPWASVFGGAPTTTAPHSKTAATAARLRIAGDPAAKDKAPSQLVRKETQDKVVRVSPPRKKPAQEAARVASSLPEDYIGVTADDADLLDAGPAASDSYDYEVGRARGGHEEDGEDDEVETALMRGPGPEGEGEDMDALLAQVARAASGSRAGGRFPPSTAAPAPMRKPGHSVAVSEEGGERRLTKKQLKDQERHLKKKLLKEGKSEEAVRQAIAHFRAAHKPGAQDPSTAFAKVAAAGKDKGAEQLPKSRPRVEPREALKTVDFMDTGDTALMASRVKRKAQDPEILDKFASDDDDGPGGQVQEVPGGKASTGSGAGRNKTKKHRRGAAEPPKGAELKSSVSIYLRHLGKHGSEDDHMKWEFRKGPKYSRGDGGSSGRSGTGGVDGGVRGSVPDRDRKRL